jgi:hypothetical protein
MQVRGKRARAPAAVLPGDSDDEQAETEAEASPAPVEPAASSYRLDLSPYLTLLYELGPINEDTEDSGAVREIMP